MPTSVLLMGCGFITTWRLDFYEVSPGRVLKEETIDARRLPQTQCFNVAKYQYFLSTVILFQAHRENILAELSYLWI